MDKLNDFQNKFRQLSDDESRSLLEDIITRFDETLEDLDPFWLDVSTTFDKMHEMVSLTKWDNLSLILTAHEKISPERFADKWLTAENSWQVVTENHIFGVGATWRIAA